MWYKNGTLYNSQQSIRLENKDTSLPNFMSDALLADMGYLLVIERTNPANEHENGFYDGVELIDGIPYLKWRVEQKSKDELATIEKELLAKEAQDALNLLNDTQWVESYIIRHEQGIITIPSESNKWVLRAQRLDAIALLKEMGY